MREIIILATGKEVLADDKIANQLIQLGRAILKPVKKSKEVYVKVCHIKVTEDGLEELERIVPVKEEQAIKMAMRNEALIVDEKDYVEFEQKRMKKEKRELKKQKKILAEPGGEV